MPRNPEDIPHWLRPGLAVLASGGAAGAAVLLKHRSSRPLVGHLSLPSLIVLVVCGLAALSGTFGAFSPTETLRRRLPPFRWAGDAVREGPPLGSWRHGLILLSLAVLAFGVIQARFWSWNLAPFDDERNFVDLARWLAARGGPGKLPALIVRGEYAESNRQPFYLGLLAIHPTLGFGRAVSIGCGLATLLLTFWGVARRHGPLSGGLTASLVAANAAFEAHAARALCETLLLFWIVLAWLAAERQAGGSAGRAFAAAACGGVPWEQPI